ncbi:di-heme-cytochrome C peroxidase [Neolewinella persica]|uniref:di-heme-cytochrome C peroxidase n=1 Tax=Neolewinella persica TaxID=70998 RepID=UPI000372B74B|nr:di-heme-cytochrome C peroxidase [Neolewinella persica]
MKKIYACALLMGLIVVCCAPYKDLIPDDTVYYPADGSKAPMRESFEQGLNNDERGQFWFTPQGAHVLPYDWFTWLEQPDNEKFFRSNDYMGMLGYLPMDSSRMNPSGLPVGFAMSRAGSQKEAFVGFTCAACHTNELEYQGKKFLVDGAPTLANFVGFFDNLVLTLNRTYDDPEKFGRFAKRVLGDDYQDTEAQKALRERLQKWMIGATERQGVNATSPHLPKDFTSYGRLDAFTNIENAGTAFALNLLSNRNATNAPVSYPFLWGTHQSDRVQWNGSAPNIPRAVGPMVRNIGQVVGVFGGLEMEKAPLWKRLLGHRKIQYSSTIDFESLGQLEGLVRNIQAPRWNDPASNLPELDTDKISAGRILFANNCQSCHQTMTPEQWDEPYNAVLTPVKEVGTDPMTSWTAEHHMASTGILKGTKGKVLVGKRFPDSTQSISISVNGVAGLVLKHPGKVVSGIANTNRVKPRQAFNQNLDNRDAIAENRADEHDLMGNIDHDHDDSTPTIRNLDGLYYKARPLNGIWATAPYLHNGSIPNLWALLTDPPNRPTAFWVGSTEFDPTRVGFVDNKGKNEFKVRDNSGNIIEGNSNLGHNYGTHLTDEEKWALIEFMKSM